MRKEKERANQWQVFMESQYIKVFFEYFSSTFWVLFEYFSSTFQVLLMAGLAGIMSKKKADEANKGALIKAKWGAVAPQQKKP